MQSFNLTAYVATTEPVSYARPRGPTLWAWSQATELVGRSIGPTSFPAAGPPTSGILGTAAITLGTLTLASSTGTVAIVGTSAVALDALALTSAAKLEIKAASAITLAGVTITSATTVAIKANASITLGAVTLSSAGTVAIAGSLAVTLGTLTLTSAGALYIVGSASITLADLTTSPATGALAIVGTESTTLGALNLSSHGVVALAGALAKTLDAATLSSTGVLPNSGALYVTLGELRLNTSQGADPYLTTRSKLRLLYEKRDYVFAATVNWSAAIRGSETVVVGDVIYLSDDGVTYVPISSPNRTGIAKGIVKTTTNGGNAAEIVWGGNVDNSITGLGNGEACMVRIGASGQLERALPIGTNDEVLGWCDAYGNALLLFSGFGAIPMYRGDVAPTTNTWTRGDIVWNTLPSSGGYAGWICTASGTPGTWKTFGLIS